MIGFFTTHWKITVYVAVPASLTAAWLLHRLYKMWQRRCPECGSIWVEREHEFEQICGRFGLTSTRTKCRKCSHRETIKDREERTFSQFAWVWRLIFYRKRTTGKRAGTNRRLYVEQCRAELALFTIRNFEAGKQGDLAPKPRLDVPQPIELSPHRKIGVR